METWTGLYKWFVELAGEAKLVIALLLALNCYFGYNSWATGQEFKELQKEYFKDTKDCTTKVAESNKQWSIRVDSINAKWQNRYDGYRTTTEAAIKASNEKLEDKYDALLRETRSNQSKVSKIEEASNNIKDKIE